MNRCKHIKITEHRTIDCVSGRCVECGKDLHTAEREISNLNQVNEQLKVENTELAKCIKDLSEGAQNFATFCFCERPPYAGPKFICDNCKFRSIISKHQATIDKAKKFTENIDKPDTSPS